VARLYNPGVTLPIDATPAPARPHAAPAEPRVSPDDSAGSGAGHAWHGVDHYENFPVGSWLLPRHLRPAVFAIYRFARHADDIADEGDADAATRDAQLEALHQALNRAEEDRPAAGQEAGREPVVERLAPHVRRHRLTWRYFHDLIDAFQQDLRVRRYPDPAAVDDYCRRSADPVGRLMLELFDAATPANHAASDAICSALQRVNFLQDVVIDLRKDRIYLPLSTLSACGVDPAHFEAEAATGRFSGNTRRAIAIEADRARRQLLQGRKLLDAVPARLGLELRFILAGGLQILDRLKSHDHDVAAARPTLGWRDAPSLLHKALTLSRQEARLR
jgi:squalene synthase HpnC